MTPTLEQEYRRRILRLELECFLLKDELDIACDVINDLLEKDIAHGVTSDLFDTEPEPTEWNPRYSDWLGWI